MILLVDVNLSPLWIPYFERHGVAAVYWLNAGRRDAPDSEILEYAAAHGYVVMTHDLDFGGMLAAGSLAAPSVIQILIQDVLPDAIGGLVLQSLQAFAAELDRGALVTITRDRGRARLLPVRPKPEPQSE